MFRVVLLGVCLAGLVASVKAQEAPPETPATATTQPADPHAPEDAVSILARTKIGRYASGKEVLTFEEATRIETWYGLVRELIQTAIAFIPRLIVAAIFLLIFYVIYRGARRVIVGSMNKAHVDQSIRDMLGSLIKWTIMGFGLVIACNQIGVQIAALLTGVSIIGLAIGFAAQETLSNFIAGIVIFWDRPFKIDDWVEIDGTFGQVQRVSFRSTRILNTDGETIIFPNTFMLSHKLANHTTHPINRINIPIGIAYKESIDAARLALLGTVVGDVRICPEPPPEVVVEACADSSVNLILRFWISDESQERKMLFQYMEKAKKALDAAGIEIPFPHLQLFLESTPAVNVLAGAAIESARHN